jgi:hypothetical protein
MDDGCWRFPLRSYWGWVGVVLVGFLAVSAISQGRALAAVVGIVAGVGSAWWVYSGWRESEEQPPRG